MENKKITTMNKYQEAIYLLRKRKCGTDECVGRKCDDCDLEKDLALDTLQELINQQADYMSYQDLKAEYEAELQLYKMVFEQYASQIRWNSYCGKKKCDVSQTGACDKEKNIDCIDCIKQKILNKAKKELESEKNNVARNM